MIDSILQHAMTRRVAQVLGRTHTTAPLEGILRPPLEWYAASSYLLISLVCFMTPGVFLLTPALGEVGGFVLLMVSGRRFFQGLVIYQYGYNIKKLPHFCLTSKQLLHHCGKRIYKKTFVGKGFRWRTRHVQRHYDLMQQDHEKYLEVETGEMGGDPSLHGVELHEKDIFLSRRQRNVHVIYFGTTGSGKTRALEFASAQDIASDETFILIDPKGDEDLLKRVIYEAEQSGRKDDVLILHLGFPEVSAQYNPVQNFERLTEVANRITTQLPDSGDSAAFREFAWRFVNIVTRALLGLGIKPTYGNIKKYIVSVDHLLWNYAAYKLKEGYKNDFESEINAIADTLNEKNIPSHMKGRSKKHIALVHYIQKNNIEDEVLLGLTSAFGYDKTYYDKITASLLPLLDKFTSGKVSELISPSGQNAPEIIWEKVINERKIVYVGLDALTDATVATAIGNSMLADLVSLAGKLYKDGTREKRPINLYCDEANEVVGDEYLPLLNKARGCGFSVTSLTQTKHDLVVRLLKDAKANQMTGNKGTLICMRVREEETADLICKNMPQRVQIRTTTQVSSVTDRSKTDGTGVDFTSSNEDRISSMEVPMLLPHQLIDLPIGQAFMVTDGGQLYKIRIPEPKHDELKAYPNEIEELIRHAHNINLNKQKISEPMENNRVDDRSGWL